MGCHGLIRSRCTHLEAEGHQRCWDATTLTIADSNQTKPIKRSFGEEKIDINSTNKCSSTLTRDELYARAGSINNDYVHPLNAKGQINCVSEAIERLGLILLSNALPNSS